MKSFFITVLIVLLIHNTNAADSTGVMNSIVAISKNVVSMDSTLAKINNKLINGKASSSDCECTNKQLSWNQKLLIIMPVVLFLLSLLVVLKRMKNDGFSFKQAFYCDEPEDVVKSANDPANLTATVKVTLLDENGKPFYYPSTSKLIAFISGLTTLVIIICFISYYAYCMIKCIPLPDFQRLFEVIVGLGLGIIPYGVSKITGATKPN